MSRRGFGGAAMACAMGGIGAVAGMAAAGDPIEIQTIVVGDAGQAGDDFYVEFGLPVFGDVAEPYAIGVTEVTQGQYTVFLNAVASIDDPNGLWNLFMQTNSASSITRSGVPGSFSYVVDPERADKPVIFVSYFDALRFANWLHNGQPEGPQDPTTTEDGAYRLDGPDVVLPGDIDGLGRRTGWQWAVSSEDEWYKAAYAYETGWTDYPTRTFEGPSAILPPGDDNSANFNLLVPTFTPVGAYVLSRSYRGTFDQAGNVREMNEGRIEEDGPARGLRGGSVSDGVNQIRRSPGVPLNLDFAGDPETGFRLVRRVDPATLGACCLPTGACMSDVDDATCIALGGTFLGVGTTCDDAPCGEPTGACCLPNDTCVDGMTEAGCLFIGGTWGGADVACADEPCEFQTLRVHVDAGARPGGDGATWATAFRSLQDALDVAVAGEEVWIAEGTYFPDDGQSVTPGSQNATFRPAAGVQLVGSLPFGATSREESDPDAHPSILEGDIGVPGDASDNSFRILEINNSGEGLDVHRGLVVARGAQGILVSDGRARLQSLRILENTGGGVRAVGNDLVEVLDCEFRDNVNTIGGGLDIRIGRVESCLFVGNHATSSAGAAEIGILVEIVDCRFEENTADGNGGAMRLNARSIVRDSVFRGNSAQGYGAILVQGSSIEDSVIRDCLFIDNSANFVGAVGTNNVSVQLVGGAFISNASTAAVSAFRGQGATSVVNTVFIANHAGGNSGAAVSIRDGATLVNCTIIENTADVGTAGLRLEGGAAAVNLILRGNRVAGGPADEAAQIFKEPAATIDFSSIEGLTGTLGGAGNVDTVPIFVDLDGPDDILGTEDDDARVTVLSPTNDAGDTTRLPEDVFDLDGDGDVEEALPIDGGGGVRVADAPDVPDTGLGGPPTVDLGAFEVNTGAAPIGTWVGPDGGSWFDPGNWQGGVLPGAGIVALVDGEVVVDAAGAEADGVIVSGGGALVIGAGQLDAIFVTIEPGGMLSLADPGALLAVQSLIVDPSAGLDWQSGTLRLLAGGLWDTGGVPLSFGCSGPAVLEVLAGAIVSTPTLTACPGGVIAGAGGLVADVVVDGRIEPGPAPATLEISGDLTVGPTGVVAIDVDGAGFESTGDRLLVLEDAVFGGTLEVAVGAGFVPGIGREDILVQADTATGVFSVRSLPRPPDGLLFSVRYDEPVPGSNDVAVTFRTDVESTGPRLFVRGDVGTPGAGQSWETAVADLQDAITIAEGFPGVVEEIWIASGTYRPDRGTGDRDRTFRVPSGVAILGGFAGDEASADERDAATPPAILSGDLAGDDVVGNDPFDPSTAENARHVMTAEATGPLTTLDRLVITGGRADDPASPRGGGVLLLGGSLRVVDGEIARSDALGGGGGLAAIDAELVVEGGRFLGNGVVGNARGGGLLVSGGTAAISGTTLEENRAGSFGVGAGLYVTDGANVAVDGSSFLANVSGRDGAGAAVVLATATFTACDFTDNIAGDGGGLVAGDASVDVLGGSFTGNSVTGDGGAIRFADSSGTIEAVAVTGNTADVAGGGIMVAGGSVTVRGGVVSGNLAGERGGGIATDVEATLLVDDVLVGANESSIDGGGIHSFTSTVDLVDVLLEDNVAAADGGGVLLWRGLLTGSGVTIRGGTAARGSGVFNRNGTLRGGLLVEAPDVLVNAGRLEPGLAGAPLVVQGTLRQESVNDFDFRIPAIGFPASGTRAGIDHPVVDAAIADIGASIEFSIVGGWVPSVGDQLEIVTTPDLASPPDVVIASGLPAGLRLAVANVADEGVRLGFTSGTPGLEFQEIQVSPASFEVRDVVLGDLDGDGDQDVVVLQRIPGSFGVLQPLENLGTADGFWLGLKPAPFILTEGSAPQSLRLADIDGDGVLDALVADSGVSGLRRHAGVGGGTIGFGPGVAIATGGGTSFIALGDVDGDGRRDLLTNRWFDSDLLVLVRGLDGGGFGPPEEIDAVSSVRDVALADLDGDGRSDIVALLGSGGIGLATWIAPDEGPFGIPELRDVGETPFGLRVEDLNGDAAPDVALTTVAGSLILAINRNDGTGDLSLAADVLVGDAPILVTSIDAEADGDRDILIVRRPISGPPAVEIIRDDRNGGSSIVLTESQSLLDLEAERVVAGDLDGDGVEDLVALVSSGAGAGGGGVVVRLAVPAPGCPEDLDGDGSVDFGDVLLILSSWGPCVGCPGDLDGDGAIGFADLLAVLSSFGPCPGT